MLEICAIRDGRAEYFSATSKDQAIWESYYLIDQKIYEQVSVLFRGRIIFLRKLPYK